MCQMIVVKKFHSILCLRPLLLTVAWISLFHIDNVLAWLSFSKIYVLKASFIKNFLQISE